MCCVRASALTTLSQTQHWFVRQPVVLCDKKRVSYPILLSEGDPAV